MRGDSSDPVFLKFSSRSAKDAGVHDKNIHSIYAEQLEEELKLDGVIHENAQVIALLKAGTELLKIYTSEKAMSIFLGSERLYQDMLLAMDHPDRWHMNIAVRTWRDMCPSMEFRAFVKGNTLTAISQYNHLCYFPHLVREKNNLYKRMVEYFNTHIRHRLETV